MSQVEDLEDLLEDGSWPYHDKPGRILFHFYGMTENVDGVVLDVMLHDYDPWTAAFWVVEEYGLSGWLQNHVDVTFFRAVDLYKDPGLFVIEGIVASNVDSDTVWSYKAMRKGLPSESEDSCLTDWRFPAGGDLPPLGELVEVTVKVDDLKVVLAKAYLNPYQGSYLWQMEMPDGGVSLPKSWITAWRPIPIREPIIDEVEYLQIAASEKVLSDT